MEDSKDSDVAIDDYELAKELHTFKQDMAEMKQSTRFILKRMNEIQFNKGHSDRDSDNLCPECGCSLGSYKDLLFRLQQLEVRDKKREKEVKLLVKAVQNLSERFDNFLTNLESHLDLSCDGKIGRGENIQSNKKSQDFTKLNAELKTLENVINENLPTTDNVFTLPTTDNVFTLPTTDNVSALPTTDNVSSVNSSNIPSFAAVSSVTMETIEHDVSKNILDFKTTSQGDRSDGRKGFSQTKTFTSINLSAPLIESNHQHLLNFSSVPNFSKGEIAKKAMKGPTETSKSISSNSRAAQSILASSDNSHRMDSETSNQIQHESDVDQETSQEVRSPDIPSMNQASNFEKLKTTTQKSKSQPASSTLVDSPVVEIQDSSLETKCGQETLVSQSAGSNSNSASAADGILKPNFTQIKQKQEAPSGIKTEHDDLDVNSEKKHVNIRYWKMEKMIAQNVSYTDSQCLKTVLCIDVSASMRTNNAWEQTTHFFTEFMNETEGEIVLEQQTFAITTFGIQTQIVQTMTVDLSRLRKTFESLKLGGPSPLYGGLYKALFSAESVTPVLDAEMVVYPRIILISDGHATDPTLIQGPDVVEKEKMKMIMDSTCEVAKQLAQRKVRVYCVPVGNADMTLMEKIASITHGRTYSFKDGALLAKFAKHNEDLAKVTLEPCEAAIIEDPLAGMYERTDMNINEVEPDGGAYEERANLEKSLPKLGSRVRRGPDWNRGNEDGNGVGTVVGHPREYWVNVVWDFSKKIRQYSYGARGIFDIVIVDDPRVLQFDEVIAVGCHVHRGKNWSDGNEDGGPGSRGVVLKVQEDGRVLVRWENRRKMYCNFGNKGQFSVEICNPFDDSFSVQQLQEWVTTSYPPSTLKSKNKNTVNKNKNKNKNS
ncbi:hypothetical protein CHS0354_038816 [Potamilus streckersoni]|uniref:VWFA domain-containing protein n=1 Tax=Potamilus streckersoni TaxID=2493646 RepID=A0AAE0TGZ4_9BIVA|nr:hypothetical protein CHS0354_038816 [Potamilus streckersoni]